MAAVVVRARGGDRAQWGDPVLVDETLEAIDTRSINAGDVVGIGIHTGNARRGYEIGRIAKARAIAKMCRGLFAGKPILGLAMPRVASAVIPLKKSGQMAQVGGESRQQRGGAVARTIALASGAHVDRFVKGTVEP